MNKCGYYDCYTLNPIMLWQDKVPYFKYNKIYQLRIASIQSLNTKKAKGFSDVYPYKR